MRIAGWLTILLIGGSCGALSAAAAPIPAPAGRAVDFARDVRPLFARSCYACHGPDAQKGGLRLDVRTLALRGGDEGPVILPGRSAASPLIQNVAGLNADRVMPAKGPRLTPDEIAVLRAWIDQGAEWPASADLVKLPDPTDHWSFRPLNAPAIPSVHDDRRIRNPIDAFLLAKLNEKGMTFSAEADRRTLIRRVCYDLIGLPPTPSEVEQFVADPDPKAYEKLVDRLLDSPRYGERWARHWLDTVHYADTHGYDKDKVRANAWPYRDYVIRAFNEDKAYSRFVKEQLAGDWFYPGTPDGIVALGMIAAGPFDFVGQVEVRDGTIDKAITRNLDRDDMVTTTMNTFVSLTVQCARCHNHKFDPILQSDYYSLQAVFAGVDRADRPYDPDPSVARQRIDLARKIEALGARRLAVAARVATPVAPQLAQIDRQIAELASARGAPEQPQFGYHSAISPTQDAIKWVQVDLGAATPIRHVLLVGAHDTFNDIGDGFGFPLRFKVEASDDPSFARGVTVLSDNTSADFPNPGVRPQSFDGGERLARYVRVTATKLAPRLHDFIFALGELMVLTPDGSNAALHRPVASLDSIEAPVRWGRQNLVDGYYFGAAGNVVQLADLQERRRALLEQSLDETTRSELAQIGLELDATTARLNALPPRALVFAAASDFTPVGNLTPTHGKPRAVHVLIRGSEKNPGQEVGPGAVGFIKGLPGRFDLPEGAEEAQRRAALAAWIVDPRNPLTWRSIVNRVWQYHFGRGIVETPNDFGRMGARPTHPELLDWLAAQFRDGGGPWIPTPQSLKALHRLIVTSTAYRQSDASNPAFEKIDGGNEFLWRMNRQRLDAEAVRDTVLLVSGKLDLSMGGPGYMTCGFVDDHSPHYKYAEFDPDEPQSLRRSIYRLTVRSVPDPFMESLDCADASQLVPRRNETLTALQALALLNDKFIVRMSAHFAERLRAATPDPARQIDMAYEAALGRSPTANEARILGDLARKDGLANVCRLIFNCNEFLYVE